MTSPAITLESSNALITGNVSTAGITLGWGGRVTGVINCTNAANTCNCVTNNSGYAIASSNGPTCSNPVAINEWRLDEKLWSGSTGEVADTMGSITGTALGSATTLAAGEVCRAGKFTGAGTYVSLGHPTLPITNQFAVSTWINWQISPSSGNSWANIFSYNATAASDSGVFWLQHSSSNGVLEFAVSTSSGRQYVQSSASTSQNQWQLVVGVYDGSKLYIYVNGVLSGSTTQTGTVSSPPADAVLTIGRWANSSNNYRQFNGYIDEVKLYGQALSAAQVATLYANESAGMNADASFRSCPMAAVADYHLDESSWNGTAGEVKDSSGNALNGTANNAQATTSGVVCGAGSFNGTSADIQVANSTALTNAFNAATTISFSAWAKAGAYTSSKIFQRGDWDGHGLGMDTWNGWQASFYINGASTTLSVGSRPALNQWYHLTGTYDGSTASLYVNGSLVKSVSVSGSLTSNGRPIAIGSAIGQKYFNGQIDEPHVFAQALTAAQVSAIYSNEQGGRSWDGSSRTCSSSGAPAAMNAVDTSAGAVSGKIGTKTAGTGFNLDIYALNAARSGQDNTFAGSVLVDLVANTALNGNALDSQSCPTAAGTTNLSVGTATLAAGKGSIAVPALANAWRDVRVRMRYPATGTATLTACSADNFAVKPSYLSAIAQDSDPATAGTNRTLNVSTATGTPVHKAGQPFTLTATAYSASNAVTTNYNGTPVPAGLSAVTGTLTGTLGTGSGGFTASNGTANSSTATYSDVGSFNVQLQDTGFAAVDANDGTAATCSGYYVCSATVTLGRFVPDHYAVTPISASPACGSFTYFGQDGLATTFILAAQNASGAPTPNYAGLLATLGIPSYAQFGFTTTGMTPAATPISGASAPSGGPWSSGSASFVATHVVSRPASLTGPGTLSFYAAPTDTDSITVGSTNPALASATFLYGRLQVFNAYGTDRASLAVPVQARYWGGNSWVVSTGDSCTSIPAASVALSGQTGTLSASNMSTAGNVTSTGGYAVVLSGGSGNIVLKCPYGTCPTATKPSAAYTGTVSLAVNLGSATADLSCLASHPASTGANLAWLRYSSGACGSGQDPSGQASFGIYSPETRKTVHIREIY